MSIGAPQALNGQEGRAAPAAIGARRRVASLGLATHWLRGPAGGGKVPIVREWQKAPWTPPELAHQDYTKGYNLGVRCGWVADAPLSVVVVDLDSPEALAWAAQHLPPTPWRTITSKGEHWYFRHPGEGVALPNKAHVHGMKLDVRGDGGQVVVAPSIHSDGHVYREATPWQPAELPVFQAAWFHEQAPTSHARGTDSVPGGSRPRSSRPAAYERARLYLAAMPAAVSGQGGHGATWEAAQAAVVGFDLSEGEALDLLQEYNGRCVPPWTEQELRHKITDAATKSKLLRGYLLDAQRGPQGVMAETGPLPPPVDEVGARRQKRRPEMPEWEADLARDSRAALIRCPENLIAILVNDARWAGVLGFNEMATRPHFLAAPPWHPIDAPSGGAQPGPVHDDDITRLMAWLGREYSIRPSVQLVEQALLVVCRKRTFHPVRDYLASLVWDGKRRLDTWLCRYTGAADTPYVRLVGRLWMISAVARVRRPGCLAKYVLSLEGAQDIYKSTACRTLADPWFKDSQIRLGDKDAMISLRESWIIELSEADALTRSREQSALKAFISSPEDSYRPPFARTEQRFPRSCVFIGTLNPGGTGYLHDPTGNVRWWPVACSRIDADALGHDRDQLWAETVAEFEDGKQWWPETPAEHALCAAQQEERYLADAREQVIADWLKTSRARQLLTDNALTAALVMEDALKLEPRDMGSKSMQTAVGLILHRLGYERGEQRRDGDARIKPYRKVVPT